MKSKILALSLFLIITVSAQAVMIVNYTFETAVQTAASVDPYATASSFTLSSGAVTFPAGNPPSATTAISGTAWRVADGAKWWEFTVTAAIGYQLDLTSLTFDDRASGTGPANWSVTVNGIGAATGLTTDPAFSANPMNTVDLTGISYQDLNSAVVKIFGYNGSGTTDAGTWRLDNVAMNGTVTRVSSVPDSLSFGFVAVALFGVFALARILPVQVLKT